MFKYSQLMIRKACMTTKNLCHAEQILAVIGVEVWVNLLTPSPLEILKNLIFEIPINNSTKFKLDNHKVKAVCNVQRLKNLHILSEIIYFFLAIF